MTDIAPGWYRDPVDPQIQRYWDGEAYVGEPIPADATPPDEPPAAEQSTTVPPAAEQPAVVEPASVAPEPVVLVNSTTAPTAQPATYPYPPPQTWPAYPKLVLPAPRPHGLPLAGFGARFVARMIDTLAVLGLNVLVNGWFVYKFFKTLGPFMDAAFQQGGSTDGLQPPPEASNLMVVILVLAAALWFAYEVPQIANTGQTLGKRLLGIRVMQVDSDEQLGFRRAIRRWNTLGLPTLLWPCYGLGFVLQVLDCLWLLFDRPLRQALHDKSALTVVVTVGVSGSEGTRPKP